MYDTVYETTELYNEKMNKPKLGNIAFEKIIEGHSIFIPFADVSNESYLRAIVSTASSKHNKNFKCVKNNPIAHYEISIFKKEIEYKKPDYPIYENSEIAKMFPGMDGKRKYPFAELPEGKSFIVPIEGTNETSLRTSCSVQSKKLNKKFVCIAHKNDGIYEVACIKKVEPTFYETSKIAYEVGNRSFQNQEG